MLDNFMTLVLILTPLILGFILPIPHSWTKTIEQMLSKLVFIILLFIGLSLSEIQNLGSQIRFIVFNVSILAICCMGSGLVGLMLFDKFIPWQRQISQTESQKHVSILGSILQIACVVIGFLAGKMLPIHSLPIDTIIKGLLMLLILLVGIQLSHSGMTLKQVLMNKRGVQISIVFCASVAIGGMIFGLIMPDVGILKGLALSSGYGWYSLSGIIMTDAYGAMWGSIALVNDLLREFVALFFIPFVMRYYPSSAVGLGGATSMDFTLPVIQSSGGIEIVPIAMSFGFIVNIVSPIFMIIFSAIG